MNTLDLDKLEHAVKLARELERIAESVTPMLQLIDKLGGDAVIPVLSDRLIDRKVIRKALHIGNGKINGLIRRGDLTPLYVEGSKATKFRLSEVEKILRNLSIGITLAGKRLDNIKAFK